MAIRLIFTYNRELLNFIIESKKVLYTDRKWGKWLQCLPPNPELTKKVKMSRNTLPAFLIQMFQFSKDELKEYNDAKTDEDLALLIVRDAGLKGVKLLSKQSIELK